MNPETDIPLILDYLAGKLEGEALAAFEARVAAEPALAEELQVQEGMDKVLKAGRREELDARLRAVRARNHGNDAGNRSGKLPSWTWAAAAVVLLLVVIGVWRLGGSGGPEGLYGEYFERYTVGGPVRSPDGTESPFEVAWGQYLKGEYAAALAFFAGVQPDDSIYDRVQMYAGICELELGKLPEAKKRWESILAKNGNPFSDDARWYLGLTLLKMEDWKGAKGHFEAMQADWPGYRRAAVAAVLRGLGG
jgi:tetratricopeptide (TPR) repeat protein